MGGFELDSDGGSQNGSPMKFAANGQQSARQQFKYSAQALTNQRFSDEITRMLRTAAAGSLAGAKLNSGRCQPAWLALAATRNKVFQPLFPGFIASMPIRLKCSCGKVLNVRDELAGKAVKCPGCQTPLRVPASGAAAPPTKAAAPAPRAAQPGAAAAKKSLAAKTAPAAVQPAVSITDGSLDDLFNEAGFELRTGKTCPGCFAPLANDAVLCTHCGLNLTTGEKLRAHTTEFEDEQSGEAYLKKAALDMERSQQMQDKMVQGAGLPWWMLGLILFLLGSTTAVAVIAVNMSKREEGGGSFDAMGWMYFLSAIAAAALAIGAYAVVIYRACMESVKEGLLVLFLPPYTLYYGFSRFRSAGKPLLLAIIAGAAAGGLLHLWSSR